MWRRDHGQLRRHQEATDCAHPASGLQRLTLDLYITRTWWTAWPGNAAIGRPHSATSKFTVWDLYLCADGLTKRTASATHDAAPLNHHARAALATRRHLGGFPISMLPCMIKGRQNASLRGHLRLIGHNGVQEEVRFQHKVSFTCLWQTLFDGPPSSEIEVPANPLCVLVCNFAGKYGVHAENDASWQPAELRWLPSSHCLPATVCYPPCSNTRCDPRTTGPSQHAFQPVHRQRHILHLFQQLRKRDAMRTVSDPPGTARTVGC